MYLGIKRKVKESGVKEIRIIQHKLDMLQAKLSLKQKSMKRLIDEMIHQTRTPLTILKTKLEGIDDGVILMDKNVINICEEQIKNITYIISNIGNMIEAEKEIEIINLERFQIDKMIDQIITGMKTQFERKGIDLVCKTNISEPIYTDRNLLSQCIYNILTNAYKYTQPGGSVEVEYFFTDDNINIVVRDTGTGIKKDELEKIFEPYYRGSSSNNSKGEGIGLYIARENVRKIGGSISAASTEGKGSEFTIRLPLNNKENTVNE